ncbi:SNARE domain containing protein [Histomonas meleagridis]|uniref:SNARE domain containing protein n=1 Tax=Histomonas meleagridis TaxID=135588 RepID=UPI00355A9A23|nr:SNARE domain containing protein [Histomonas meleagridis]KAH0801995.1 SNARE domain containing protein [Histomonas meleagridis]
MYLATNGANRDRTLEVVNYRGSSSPRPVSSPSYSDTELLLSGNGSSESLLQPYFDLANEIKMDISRLDTAYDTILKKQKECLRPTFVDSSDLISEINTLTSNINSKLQDIYQRISYLTLSDDHPDRKRILENIRSNLLEQYKQFSFKFKMAQQTFSMSFTKKTKPKKRKQVTNDFEPFDFGEPGSERRQAQLQDQRSNEQIEQIAQRAEEVRSIFMELSTIIAEQGTVIDRIDYNINESLSNAIEAHKSIEKAAKYQKKSRMWICAVVLAVMVVLLFVLALTK